MLLGMELFLLARHTHPPLRTEMEDIHTQKHVFTQPQSYWWRADGGLVQRHGGGGFSNCRWGVGGGMHHYLTMEDFSQGLLRVSEERETSVMNSAHSFESTSQCCGWQHGEEKVPHSPL